MNHGASDLLARYLLSRDDSVFTEIVQAHLPLVRAACARILADPAAIDDAIQETFWRLSLHAAEIQTSLSGWLHTSATRIAIDLRRREATRFGTAASAAACASPSEDSRAAPEVLDIVRHAVQDLPSHEREAITLHFFQGQGIALIAEHGRVAATTVHRRLDQGLQRLRGILQRRGVETPVGCSVLLLLASLRDGKLAAWAPAAIPPVSPASPASSASDGAGRVGGTARPAASRAAQAPATAGRSLRRWPVVAALLVLAAGLLWAAGFVDAGPDGADSIAADPDAAATAGAVGAGTVPRSPSGGAVDGSRSGAAPRTTARTAQRPPTGGSGLSLGEDAALAASPGAPAAADGADGASRTRSRPGASSGTDPVGGLPAPKGSGQGLLIPRGSVQAPGPAADADGIDASAGFHARRDGTGGAVRTSNGRTATGAAGVTGSAAPSPRMRSIIPALSGVGAAPR